MKIIFDPFWPKTSYFGSKIGRNSVKTHGILTCNRIMSLKWIFWTFLLVHQKVNYIRLRVKLTSKSPFWVFKSVRNSFNFKGVPAIWWNVKTGLVFGDVITKGGVTVCSIAATVNTGSVCIGGSKPHPSGTYQSSNNLFHNSYHTIDTILRIILVSHGGTTLCVSSPSLES